VTHVRWTEQAVADLRAIREYIERDSPQYGRLVAERLFDSTTRLEAFPRSGRIVQEVGRDDLREIVVGDYRLVYRLDSDAAILLTVFRSSRLLPRGLEAV
jgi:addiction module RelE/StbE family toxin